MGEPEATAGVCDIVSDVLSEQDGELPIGKRAGHNLACHMPDPGSRGGAFGGGSGPDPTGTKALVYKRDKDLPSLDSRFM